MPCWRRLTTRFRSTVQQTKASTLMLQEEEKSLAKLAQMNAEKEAKEGVAENLDLEGKGTKLCADISANVWKVCVAEGDEVEEGAEVLVLEAMKMEISVFAPVGGIVKGIRAKKGELVEQGAQLMFITPN